MGWITGIAGFFSALVQVIKLLKEVYISWKDIKERQKIEEAVDANERGDSIALEQSLGNPDAGKPSGIGEIREKKK